MNLFIFIWFLISFFILDERSEINARDTFLKKADIKSVKNKIDQQKIAAQKRNLNYQDPAFHTLQNTNKKQKVETEGVNQCYTDSQQILDSKDNKESKESKPLLKILSQQQQKPTDTKYNDDDDVICDEKPKYDLKKYCVYCQKPVTNITSHNKGTKHLDNVYNSQIIMEKEGIRISRKHFKALETKEQWLSDSVSLYETLMITK